MTSQTAPMTPSEIAKRLPKAQKRAVMILPQWIGARWLSRTPENCVVNGETIRASTIRALAAKGLAWAHGHQAGLLTAGLAVRAHLAQQIGDSHE